MTYNLLRRLQNSLAGLPLSMSAVASVLILRKLEYCPIMSSVEDIRTYINQTVTVVEPMLSRIGKCRKLIQKQTDNNLDILGDSSLLGYQRYFGDY